MYLPNMQIRNTILSKSSRIPYEMDTGTTVNPIAHPMQAASEVMGKMGVSEMSPQKMSLFQSATEGPAEIAAKISGVKEGISDKIE